METVTSSKINLIKFSYNVDQFCQVNVEVMPKSLCQSLCLKCSSAPMTNACMWYFRIVCKIYHAIQYSLLLYVVPVLTIYTTLCTCIYRSTSTCEQSLTCMYGCRFILHSDILSPLQFSPCPRSSNTYEELQYIMSFQLPIAMHSLSCLKHLLPFPIHYPLQVLHHHVLTRLFTGFKLK